MEPAPSRQTLLSPATFYVRNISPYHHRRFIATSIVIGARPSSVYNTGYYNDTISTTVHNSTQSAELSLSFEGTSLKIIGSIGCLSDASTCGYWVSIDGQSNHQIHNPGINDDALFYSQTLTEGNHTITLSNFTADVIVDYALIEPSPSVNVVQQTLYVSDDDPSILYKGAWQTQTTGGHTSTTKGDSISCLFEGSSLTVRGVENEGPSGNYTVGFSVDSQPQVIKIYGFSTNAYLTYFLFDSVDLNDTTPGITHIIKVDILDVQGSQSFVFGGFYYTPTFSIFGQKPDSAATPSSLSTVSVPTSFSLPTSGVDPGAGTPTSGKHGKNIIAGIVGGIVGCLAVILMILLALRRHQKSRRKSKDRAQTLPSRPYPKAYAQSSHGSEVDPESPEEAYPPTVINEAAPNMIPRINTGTVGIRTNDLTIDTSGRLVQLIQSLHEGVNEISSPPPYARDQEWST